MDTSPKFRGVSAVVSVILMVAITVILAAVLAYFVLGLDLTGDTARAAVQTDKIVLDDGDPIITIDILSLRNADYVAVTTTSGVAVFNDVFESDRDDGLMYREQRGAVEWAEKDSDGMNKQYLPAPANSGTVAVSFDFEGSSYEGSGAAIYAVDANDNTHVIRCDAAGGDGNKPADMPNPSFTCNNKGSNYHWTNNVEVTASAEIERVYLVTDLENVEGEWYDRAIFRDLTVTSPDSGETISACVSCAGVVTANDDMNHDGDDRYGPSNDVDEVGEVISISNIEPGHSITVFAGLNGEETVIHEHEVE